MCFPFFFLLYPFLSLLSSFNVCPFLSSFLLCLFLFSFLFLKLLPLSFLRAFPLDYFLLFFSLIFCHFPLYFSSSGSIMLSSPSVINILMLLISPFIFSVTFWILSSKQFSVSLLLSHLYYSLPVFSQILFPPVSVFSYKLLQFLFTFIFNFSLSSSVSLWGIFLFSWFIGTNMGLYKRVCVCEWVCWWERVQSYVM